MSSTGSAALRESVWRANQSLVEAGLVHGAFGNASGIDRAHGIILIKPSGVPYGELRPEHLVAVGVDDGRIVDGDLRPSSDTPTHLALYRRFPEIGGVVHTHSPEATAWAQACRPIPAFGTTHADHFRGAVPVTRQLQDAEVAGEYEHETGMVIVEALETAGFEAADMPAALVAWHGPFTWGPDPEAAAANAVALELVAGVARRTLALDPDAQPMPAPLLERHFRRKHGSTAYYGQRQR